MNRVLFEFKYITQRPNFNDKYFHSINNSVWINNHKIYNSTSVILNRSQKSITIFLIPYQN